MNKLSAAPVLTTERLILRGPEREDLPFTRFMTSAPSLEAQGETVTAEQAWFGFLTGIGHWQWHGFGFFTVVEKQTGQPVGRVGLIRHSNWPEVELAWHLFEEGEGKGFATEAAIAVRTWAARRWGWIGCTATSTGRICVHRPWRRGLVPARRAHGRRTSQRRKSGFMPWRSVEASRDAFGLFRGLG
ncbi:GNAT family N-acetyltransferase [Sulfitobacter porphyrae]|uniref:GNAT family N-acetyltransferase n=1 Tax=Sulfitobacter porphyrae TaxID=1246864 RepID=A0ABW2B0V0_9RHOB